MADNTLTVGSTANTWSGDVELRSFDTTARSFFLGADLGTSLSLSGSIVGTDNTPAPLATNAVLKVGGGTLVYTGAAPNQITGNTGVLDGTLALNKLVVGVNAIAGALQVGDNVGSSDAVEIRAAEQIANAAAVTVNASGTLRTAASVVAGTTNDVETVTFSATATAGTWTLTFPVGYGGVTGTAVTLTGLAFNITPSALEAQANTALTASGTTVRVGGMAQRLYTFALTSHTTVPTANITANTTGLTPASTTNTVATTLAANQTIAAGETIGTPTLWVGDGNSAAVEIADGTFVALNNDLTLSVRPGTINAAAAAVKLPLGGTTGRLALLAPAAAAATRTLTVNVGPSAVELSVSAPVVDRPEGGVAAALTKAGAGRMVLANDNTYSGTTTVSAGAPARRARRCPGRHGRGDDHRGHGRGGPGDQPGRDEYDRQRDARQPERFRDPERAGHGGRGRVC